MPFTVKARVANVEAQGDQVKVSFIANYTDPVTGERINEEWAKATPNFSNGLYVKPEIVERDGLAVGQGWTLTYVKDEPETP